MKCFIFGHDHDIPVTINGYLVWKCIRCESLLFMNSHGDCKTVTTKELK